MKGPALWTAGTTPPRRTAASCTNAPAMAIHQPFGPVQLVCDAAVLDLATLTFHKEWDTLPA